ncbi:glutathione synthase [Shewanella putrefaciens]|uniref:glutathione synthase n=1 Tax=Shewanella putrefaciens TaxID=24 RepID=A0ABX8XF92_SHEPU|nr:glutathione synthase [Shewanella putrefaciens]AVV83210.1 glutathione synthase [Shewanella putrefaciens]MCT8942466.1 glutathione synthetase [Shewanella putrefaciens]QSE50500.1 glutathione synthase [Shewanella putrefaciens]QYX73910.1 glutathione synthase [Shewanella putrefaciens]GGN13054.1 glutathione synthase [Shewanella putrefaciens]
MNSQTSLKAKDDAIEWALTHGMAFKQSPYSARHAPFTLTPSLISRTHYQYLKNSVHLLGKLIHYLSEEHAFLIDAIQPITVSEPFFAALLNMHQQLHDTQSSVQRMPLLIMRSDFMDDKDLGPKLVEFNGIAAGMGPFGQRVHQLHHYLQQWHQLPMGELVDNHAIEQLSAGIAKATFKIKQEFQDAGPARFLMIVQENEDNVFDQHLLELALQQRGIQTIRRTFSALQEQVTTGEQHRLILEGIGTIDTVYLRAGYQYADYEFSDIDGNKDCHALMGIRVLIEQHRVALNATIGQQLATSKRMQMLLSSMDEMSLTQFGLTLQEAQIVKSLLGEMRPVTAESIKLVADSPIDTWVLKNQGEGGGHCLFGTDISRKLTELQPTQYQAWSLMRRLKPRPRTTQTLVVRNGEIQAIDDMIPEIGMFTVHIDGEPAMENRSDHSPSYSGYLIRSKSAMVTEGGVHSGQGVLDSLMFSD